MTPNERQGASEVTPPEATQAGHQAPASPAAPPLEALRAIAGRVWAPDDDPITGET